MQIVFPLALIVGHNYVLFVAGFSNIDAEEEMNFHLELRALQREEQTGMLQLGFPLHHGSGDAAKRTAGSPHWALDGCSVVYSLPACFLL